MRFYIAFNLCFAIIGCVLLSGCAEGYHHTMFNRQNEDPNQKWLETRMLSIEEESEIITGFKPDYLYTEFRDGNKIYAFSRPAEFYGFLFDRDLQYKLDRAISTAPAGTSRNFSYRNQRYRFVSEAELYYSNHTNKPCRQGVLYREADGKYRAWDKIPSTFCKSGPAGEWLPMT